MIDVPQPFAREITEREGADGARWIASLPELVDELCARWSCTPSGWVMHGRVGIVVPVRRGDGSSAVLKVSFPHPGNDHEPVALATWSGRGAVLLYERDDARYAMLLERVDHSTLLSLDDTDEAAAICGRLTRRLAVPAPPNVPRLSERAKAQERALLDAYELLTDHVPRRVVDTAIDTIRELAMEQPDTLVHGDLHDKNVVRGTREPWLAIDPKGFAGDPAVSAMSVVIGGYQRQLSTDELCAELLRRLAIFADAAELDRERVIRWTQAHALLYACHKRTMPGKARDGTVHLAERVATVLA